VNGPDHPEGAPRQEGRGWRFYLIVVAAILLLIFVIQNSQKVPVDFLFASTDTPLFFALLLAGALGALIGWAWPHVRRDRRRERDLEKRD
jgi:uncharacterized integral membrane protein